MAEKSGYVVVRMTNQLSANSLVIYDVIFFAVWKDSKLY